MDYSSNETRQHLRAQSLEGNPRRAFAFDGGTTQASFDWHSHAYHQLLYAPRGAAIVESPERRYLLPPLRAALIAAESSHRTVVGVKAKPAPSISVFFHPGVGGFPYAGIHTLDASPLLRELVQNGYPVPSALSISCFATLALLCAESCQASLPFWLPRAGHPGIARALDHV